jgi:hypothetical protein
MLITSACTCTLHGPVVCLPRFSVDLRPVFMVLLVFPSRLY